MTCSSLCSSEKGWVTPPLTGAAGYQSFSLQLPQSHKGHQPHLINTYWHIWCNHAAKLVISQLLTVILHTEFLLSCKCYKVGSIFTLVATYFCEVQNMSSTGYTNMACHLSCCKFQQRCQTTVLETCHRVLEVTQYCNHSLLFML